MVRWWYDLHERMIVAGVICYYYIEANFLQDIILDEFTREGIYAGTSYPYGRTNARSRTSSSASRGISPLWERGFVFYNADRQNDPDTLAGLEQTLAFEKRNQQPRRRARRRRGGDLHPATANKNKNFRPQVRAATNL